MAELPSLDTKFMWQHTNSELWRGAFTLELGAGIAALPSMTALRCDAAKVVITEQNQEVLEQIQCNLERNFDKKFIGEKVRLMSLDWLQPDDSLARVVAEMPNVDFVFASDLFYDPCVFESLISLLRKLFDRFPLLEAFVAYQIRDSDWSVEELLVAQGMRCSLIRCVDTDQHSICLAKFACPSPTLSASANLTFAGVEGYFRVSGCSKVTTHSISYSFFA
ncbi:hypothetical protein niasHS_013534 [Heterodera schachtii]|uniref:Uncharacterized protein n=1 Tax=Heterodera schachtii TaxID=97005 RepID=A0ABD2ISG9_HETSC